MSLNEATSVISQDNLPLDSVGEYRGSTFYDRRHCMPLSSCQAMPPRVFGKLPGL